MILDIKRVDDRVILHFTFTHKNSSTSSFNVIKYKYIQIQIHGISDMSLTGPGLYFVCHLLGTFPKAFSQGATSQGYFIKWLVPKYTIFKG